MGAAPRLIVTACAELADDVRELAWIALDQAHRAECSASEGKLLEDLRRDALGDASVLEGMAGALPGSPSRCALRNVSARRYAFADAIRRRQAVLAGALVADSWQSPSIRHALRPQAGPALRRVRAHHDDYARDRHPAGAGYETLLAATRSPGAAALMTSCGMSAVVVALAWLERSGALRRGVLMGSSTYHETRDLVRLAAPLALIHDEHPDAALISAVRRLRPGCVILDAVATEQGVAVPDIARIATSLAAARPGAWLVIDITGAPLAPSPLDLPEARVGTLRVLTLESLTKHAQLGLDRVAAGALYARTEDIATLDGLREHLGANIADASVHALPSPERSVLARRLARHARNADTLAHRLAASAPTGVVVSHPALAAHPSHARQAATWLTLHLPTAQHAATFTDIALARARERKVALVEGASFGLDTTRIYAPSPGEQPDCGFVRISPGIEHCEALPRLADVLAGALATSATAHDRSRPAASAYAHGMSPSLRA
jgi:cystathionine beta-lyase/cystathionine gamma-synthase